MNVVLCFTQVTEERPPIDLFKSIFTESSASELSEDSEEENVPTKNPITATDKEPTINNITKLKEESIVQHKQLNDKSQHSITEAKGSLRDTVEPKLTWLGVTHTAKLPEQTTPSIANKPQNKAPVVTAITSSHYGPSIPPSITGELHLLSLFDTSTLPVVPMCKLLAHLTIQAVDC